MKKNHYVLLAGLVLGGVTLFPLTTGQAASEPVIYTSNGIIEFTPSEEPTTPVDPTNPTDPIKPIDPTNPEGPNPGTNGPLSIDYASSLSFGKQNISSKNEVYFADPQAFNDEEDVLQVGPNFVQVTDNRGTEAGWTLKVKQDGQFKTSEGKELSGAQISFLNGEAVTASHSGKPVIMETIVLLGSGEESHVMSAAEGTGAGTHLLAWGTNEETAKKSIKLEVPGSTTKYAKQYTTQLLWSLTDVPSN